MVRGVSECEGKGNGKTDRVRKGRDVLLEISKEKKNA